MIDPHTRHRGAAVVALWASFNAVLAAVLFAFPGPTLTWRLTQYWASVAVLTLVAVAVLAGRRSGRAAAGSSPTTGAVSPASGAPALAFAAACVVGALAWVFGVYLAYLAAPLLAFCVARWRSEHQEGRRP